MSDIGCIGNGWESFQSDQLGGVLLYRFTLFYFFVRLINVVIIIISISFHLFRFPFHSRSDEMNSDENRSLIKLCVYLDAHLKAENEQIKWIPAHDRRACRTNDWSNVWACQSKNGNSIENCTKKIFLEQ